MTHARAHNRDTVPLIELRFDLITNILLLFLLFNGFSYNDMCNLIKHLVRATFFSTPANDVHER